MVILWVVVDTSFSYVNIAHYNYTSPYFSSGGTSLIGATPITATLTTPFTISTTDIFTIVYSGLDL